MGFSREAMTSRYRRPFRYPDGFADVLRDFTREVLRDQPKSIPEYGAAYFDQILKQSAEQQVIAEEGSGAPDRMSQEQLLEYLSQVFMEADVDGSGSLSYKIQEGAPDCQIRIREGGCEADADGSRRGRRWKH